MSDTTCQTCGSDDRQFRHVIGYNRWNHTPITCPNDWHDEQPTTPKCACGLSAEVCGEAYVAPTLPEDVEAAFERIKCAIWAYDGRCWQAEQDDTFDGGCAECTPESFATLRAHIASQAATIEALTAERGGTQCPACGEAAYPLTVAEACVDFAKPYRARAEAAEQRVAVLEAVREAADPYCSVFAECRGAKPNRCPSSRNILCVALAAAEKGDSDG